MGCYDGCHVVHGRVACAEPRLAYVSLYPVTDMHDPMYLNSKWVEGKTSFVPSSSSAAA